MTAVTDQGRDHGQGHGPEGEGPVEVPAGDVRRWDDGLIARRAAEAAQDRLEACLLYTSLMARG
uniref:hypothetical protein n=1 Tax=Streptomyces sp. rh45 TaxID=3028726 RepID=UPI003C79D616